MKQTKNELASLISSSNPENEEMPIDEYVQLLGEELFDAKYNMVELMDLAWGREFHLGSTLNKEPMEGNDVDNQPTLTFKLPQAHEYAQLLSKFIMQHPLEFLIVDMMNTQPFIK